MGDGKPESQLSREVVRNRNDMPPRNNSTASILITSYNHASFLRACIDSALNQSVRAEVIVVDDGSSDGSPGIIDSYGSHLVSVRTNRAGQAGAINEGLRHATGDLVLLLDADDLADHFRAEQVASVFQHDSADWIRHNLAAIDEFGHVLKEHFYDFNHDLGFEIFERGRTLGITTSSLSFRRSFLDNLGPLPTYYRGYADAYLASVACLYTRPLTIDRSLGSHRFHRAQHFSGAEALQQNRTSYHLTLNRNLAHDVQRHAARLGRTDSLAEGRTWWQERARFEYSKMSGRAGRGEWIGPWLSHITKTLSSELPVRDRLLFALRSLILGTLPKGLYSRAWWATHYGRTTFWRSLTRR